MAIDWWEIVQTALIVAGGLWHYLITGGVVTVRLEQSRTQNGMLNYVISNSGRTKINDVRVAFSRSPEKENELWTTGASDLTFGSLSPGERHVSMFCAPAAATVEPIRVTLTYRNAPLFARLNGYLLPLWCRPLRRSTATLDMKEFLNFRYNVGFEGKRELQRLEDTIRKGLESGRSPTIASRQDIEEVTPTAEKRVKRIPAGKREEVGDIRYDDSKRGKVKVGVKKEDDV